MSNVNKANIKPIPTKQYTIYTGDVTKFLQDQLGFGVLCEYERWTGLTTDVSYVRMRVGFDAADIVAKPSSMDYVDRVLEQNSAGIMFKDTVINTIEPYRYPRHPEMIRNNPESLQRLVDLGVTGDKFNEIIRYANFSYSRECNAYGIYLRPERIIADMLSDPATGTVDGKLEIITVRGTTSDTIHWIVNVSENKSFVSNTNISVEAIFNSLL